MTTRLDYLRRSYDRDYKEFKEKEAKHRNEMMFLARCINRRREQIIEELTHNHWVRFLSYCRTGVFPDD